MARAACARLLRGLSTWVPAALRVDARERWRAVLGSAAGILLTVLASRWLGLRLGLQPWLAAPLGASAVLVFALPASPLAQPWSVLGGHAVSAAAGLACVALLAGLPGPSALPLAAAAAVAAAIALMFLTRCLHPPGGATALLVVLNQVEPRFVLMPVLLNMALLVAVGVVYNTLTGRRYPHVVPAPPPPGAQPASRFTTADLDAALVHYNQVLDVSRDDLEALLHHAEAAAYRRNLGELRCADIMSRQPVTVSRDTPLAEAWALMRQHRIKALPVVDKAAHLVGIVTTADFLRHAAQAPAQAPATALPAPVLPTALPPGRVGQIMSRRVRVAGAQLPVIALLPLFSEGGHHHLPIVGDDQRLVGILTQSDMVRALHRAVQPA